MLKAAFCVGARSTELFLTGARTARPTTDGPPGGVCLKWFREPRGGTARAYFHLEGVYRRNLSTGKAHARKKNLLEG